MAGGDLKEGINLHKKLYETLLRIKIEYFDVFKREAVKEIVTGSNNQSDTVLTKLRQKVNRANFENMGNTGMREILKGKIEPLSTSSHGDMA